MKVEDYAYRAGRLRAERDALQKDIDGAIRQIRVAAKHMPRFRGMDMEGVTSAEEAVALMMIAFTDDDQEDE